MRSVSTRSENRLWRFLLMVVFCACMTPLSMSAQKINLSMKNVTVQEAITALNQSENYSIILNADEVDLGKRINVSAKDATIGEVLDQVFAGQNVSYTIEGNRISVTRKQPAVQETPVGQTKRTIKGTVMDSEGEPLVGASLMIAGTKQGFLTDLDGNYEMTGVSFPATVIVSFIGYADTEIKMTGNEKSPYNIVLDDSQNILDDVVVIGYGTQKRANLSGAVGTVSGKDLNARPVVSAANALQGADPSVNITFGTGSPESGYNINIRGNLSLNSGSPLILADGVEVSLSQINPNDIESVSVLKDASTCAIYGAKASAGVVIVGRAQVVRFAVAKHVSYAHDEYGAVFLADAVFAFLGGKAGIHGAQFLAVDEEYLFGQEGLELRIGFAYIEFGAQYGAVDFLNGFFQIGHVSLRVCHYTFPVPLVYVQTVKVVQLFVASDGVHVRNDAESGLHLVFGQRYALPFCQTVHHFGHGLVHVLDGERHGTFNAAEVIVEAQSSEYEERGCYSAQSQFGTEAAQKEILYFFYGKFCLLQIQQGTIVCWFYEFAHFVLNFIGFAVNLSAKIVLLFQFV